MKALLVIDIQNDFCPGGSLAVSDGDAVVAPVNSLIDAFTEASLPVVLTRDWHPENHSSFKDFGGTWPAHCVESTKGAEFHPSLKITADALIVSKAVIPDTDAYSGFEGTMLDKELKSIGVDEVVVAGLATDYCIKNTVLDALKLGYKTSVAADCIRAVDVAPGDGEAAIEEMKKDGAAVTTSVEIAASVRRPLNK